MEAILLIWQYNIPQTGGSSFQTIDLTIWLSKCLFRRLPWLFSICSQIRKENIYMTSDLNVSCSASESLRLCPPAVDLKVTLPEPECIYVMEASPALGAVWWEPGLLALWTPSSGFPLCLDSGSVQWRPLSLWNMNQSRWQMEVACACLLLLVIGFKLWISSV